MPDAVFLAVNGKLAGVIAMFSAIIVLVYIFLGRYFLRGLMAGALKG